MSSTSNPSRPESEPILMDQVGLSFNGDVGVNDISLRVPPGTIFGLIGPSGCGKTTTLRLLTGVYRPDRGEVRVFGKQPHRFSQRQRKHIGYVPQQFALYDRLSVQENLSFAASLQGMSFWGRRKRMHDMLEFVELSDARKRLATHLSGGMRRRLMLACALIHRPQILFADEPTAGIDPVLRETIWEGFRQVRDAGRTLFVTTQYVGEAAYCDYVGVMGVGRIIAIDTPENLRRRALGGDSLRIELDPNQLPEASALLRQHQAFSRIRYSNDEPGVIFVTVDDAGAQLPQVLDILRQNEEIHVRNVQPYVPAFDQVFVQLMTEQEDGDAR